MNIDIEGLLAVTAVAKANAEHQIATDIYQVASTFQSRFPKLCPEEVVKLVELAVVTVGGAAVWERPIRK